MKRVHNCVWHKSAPINKYRYLHYCIFLDWMNGSGTQAMRGVGWGGARPRPAPLNQMGAPSPLAQTGITITSPVMSSATHSALTIHSQPINPQGMLGTRLASEYERVRTKQHSGGWEWSERVSVHRQAGCGQCTHPGSQIHMHTPGKAHMHRKAYIHTYTYMNTYTHIHRKAHIQKPAHLQIHIKANTHTNNAIWHLPQLYVTAKRHNHEKIFKFFVLSQIAF